MNPTTLKQRKQEFQKHCEQQKLHWKEGIKGLPDDDGVVLAALATSLKFSLHGAFDPSRSLTELENERKVSEEEAKQLEDFRRRLGSSPSKQSDKE
jgi:hypothetical protein